jgi:hypothetical protein
VTRLAVLAVAALGGLGALAPPVAAQSPQCATDGPTGDPAEDCLHATNGGTFAPTHRFVDDYTAPEKGVVVFPNGTSPVSCTLASKIVHWDLYVYSNGTMTCDGPVSPSISVSADNYITFTAPVIGDVLTWGYTNTFTCSGFGTSPCTGEVGPLGPEQPQALIMASARWRITYPSPVAVTPPWCFRLSRDTIECATRVRGTGIKFTL